MKKVKSIARNLLHWKNSTKETKRNNLYIIYKTANKVVRIRGNRQGRGEGRQEKHSFSKMQTAKRRRRAAGDFFIKMQKKTLNSPAAGVYWEFFSAKNKKIRKMQPSARAVSTPLLPGAGHSICCRIVKQAVVFLLQSLDHVVGVFVVGRRDA